MLCMLKIAENFLGKPLPFGLFGLLLAIVLTFNIYLCLSLQVYFIYNPEFERRLFRGIGRKLFKKGNKNITINTSSSNAPPFNFSACLLIKDDNQILPEWIAYHFTVLPLRHLIVAVDPFSLTSPTPILDKFREIGMDIEVWRDSDYLIPGERYWQSPARPNASAYRKIQAHRWRQREFYRSCLNAFKARNCSWTLLIDSDEYLTYNSYDVNEGRPIFWSEAMNATARHQLIKTFERKIQSGVHHRLSLPRIGQITVAQYIEGTESQNISKLKNASERITTAHWYHYPCILIPRVQFGASESTQEEISRQIPGPEFDPMKFHTMRYLKHGPKHPYPAWPGKSIVHAGLYNNTLIRNPHKVLETNCSSLSPFPDYADMDLRIHHYTGSLELFLSRPGDYRRCEEDFNKRNNNVAGSDNTIQGWLHNFVYLVGKDRALELTQELRSWAEGNDALATDLMNRSGSKNYPYPFRTFEDKDFAIH